MSLTILDSPAFLGQVGTDGTAWPTDARPKSFRERMLMMDINGMTTLTGLSSMLSNEKTTDYEFSWFEKETPIQGGAATFFTDSALSSAVTSGTALNAGDTVYAKVAEDVAKHFRDNKTILVSDDDGNPVSDRAGIVQSVVVAGANSKIAIKLLSAAAAGVVDDWDYVVVNGNAQQQGSMKPDEVGYKGAKKYNYTQIFRNPFKLTRTARKTRLRTGNPYQELRNDQLLLHGVEIERAIIFGERSEDLSGDEPLTTTRGIREWIRQDMPSNFVSYPNSADAAYTDTYWEDVAADFIEDQLTQLFLYGSQEKIGLCGAQFLKLVNKAARTWGEIELKTGATAFGLRVTEWQTPFGRVLFKTHPLFNMRESTQYSCLFLEPQYLKFRIIDDTDLFTLSDTEKKEQGFEGYDGTVEEYRAELGLEVHFPKSMAYWHLGSQNGTP